MAVIIQDTANLGAPRNIVLELKSGFFRRISDTSPAYQPLAYPVLFPYGERNIRIQGVRHTGGQDDNEEHDDDDDGGESTSRCKTVSLLEYYAYCLHAHPPEIESQHLFNGRQLFQQWIVDAWATTDQARFCWLKNNQNALRSDVASGLTDAIAANPNQDMTEIGQRFILPSSYTGGACYMHQPLQDSLALARYYGSPVYFHTVTTNPNWKEIRDELKPGQQPKDHPDLVVPVFCEKLKMLVQHIKKDSIFGHYVAHVYTIEFQKRGLPHAHILIFVDDRSRLCTPEQVNAMICAEIPDPLTHKHLYDFVTTHMIHTPCGDANPTALCMKDGKCSKCYPKPLQTSTSLTEDGYPTYHRRDNGCTFQKGEHIIDNCWVVPYNPYILLNMECHANLEACMGICAFKYIHKYVYKGGLHATLAVGDENNDEIQQHLDGRYVSSDEAVMQLFCSVMHEELPPCTRLQVHEPGMQFVVFDGDNDAATVAEHVQGATSTVIGFFAANQKEENDELVGHISPTNYLARDTLYQEFPQKFLRNPKTKKWTVHKRGWALGRMYSVPPSAKEHFYLWLLLTVVRGMSFLLAVITQHG
jgi:hypothetical protein